MLNNIGSHIIKDFVVIRLFAFIIVLCGFISTYLSLSWGIFGLFCYILGCIVPLFLLKYKHRVIYFVNKLTEFYGYHSDTNDKALRCDVCDVKNCQRHKGSEIPRKPWKGLHVDERLDRAVESFYCRILDSFVKSWFSLLSNEEDFLFALRQGLREATCHIIRKIKHVDVATVLTNKILPIVFDHMEMVQKMLNDGVTMEKLPLYFIHSERPIHPAVLNRQAEVDYLRSVAKCLIPKIFHNENFHSRIFFSLVRELIACWVLLPLMDVASDPNLINLMVIHAATSRSDTKKEKLSSSGKKVEFLKNFAEKNVEIFITRDDAFLKNKEQLYSFMQFLKKEEAVEILTFYLDVDDLNKELRDPTVTTDPAKLSALYHQSEKLIKNYHALMETKDLPKEMEATSLSEAHEKIRECLGGELRKAYFKTSDYFSLLYGSKKVKILDDSKSSEQSKTIRLGTKLKDALRGAIDGTLIEPQEVPTVWEALAEPQITGSNPTIYNSVTQKLRKERGQNLDPFLITFMQSLDQTADFGEDVVKMSEPKPERRIVTPGRSLVFGNLLELSKYSRTSQMSSHLTYYIKGPSQCFIYILHRIFHIPKVLVQLAYAFVCVSQKTVDNLILRTINKYLKVELYESHLSVVIGLLENHIFGKKQPEISPNELLERQRRARERMQKLRKGLENVIDVLQSPSLNKHLMYCTFDVILSELYPDFGHSDSA